jgi:hypothetical protein
MPPRVEEVELVDPMVGPGVSPGAAARPPCVARPSKSAADSGRMAAARRPHESVGIARARARHMAPFFIAPLADVCESAFVRERIKKNAKIRTMLDL